MSRAFAVKDIITAVNRRARSVVFLSYVSFSLSRFLTTEFTSVESYCPSSIVSTRSRPRTCYAAIDATRGSIAPTRDRWIRKCEPCGAATTRPSFFLRRTAPRSILIWRPLAVAGNAVSGGSRRRARTRFLARWKARGQLGDDREGRASGPMLMRLMAPTDRDRGSIAPLSEDFSLCGPTRPDTLALCHD